MSEYHYEALKQLAKTLGVRVTDLIALAPQNDPFYTGTPGDKANADWFAALYHQFGYGRNFRWYQQKIHIRRVHYQIVSQDPPVHMPNGKPYENTEECWDFLNLASKAARYLGLVDPASFDDRRNPSVKVHAYVQESEPQVEVSGQLWNGDTALPRFPDLPDYSIYYYDPQQRYHLELWCEKSTMNDVLEPLCQSYNMNLQTGLGELSITATLNLVNRLAKAGKPARIFYVSDFDPAGQSMPVAVSRKIEYFMRSQHLDLDIRLFPVVLTAEQVSAYQLPRTPIKESERRREGFEGRFGTGAVELDALEALHPGELEGVLTGFVNRYYDTRLADVARQAREQLLSVLRGLRRSVLDEHSEELGELEEMYATIQAEFEERMQGYSEKLNATWQAISADLEATMPAIDDYPLPEAEEAQELGEGLYNSQRDYMEQIEAYKQFQGKQ